MASRERELQRLQSKLVETQRRALDAAIAQRNRAPARPGLLAAQGRARAEEEEEQRREAQARKEEERRKRQAQLRVEREAVEEAEAAAEAARLEAEQHTVEQEAMEQALAERGDAAYDDLLRELFVQCDADGNNVLDAEEFGQLLRSPTLGLALRPGQDAQLMQALDRSGDGRINASEFIRGLRGLAAQLYASADDSASSDRRAAPWSVVFEDGGVSVKYCKSTGEIDVHIPAHKQVATEHRIMYEPPIDDFGRIALSAFLVVDGGGSGILSKVQVQQVLRSPDLNLQLTDDAIAAMAAEVPRRGLGFGPFLTMMRRCLAAVYLSSAPAGSDWYVLRVEYLERGVAF